jgi:predicted transcriptional regulator
METQVLIAHVPRPLAEKVGEIAARLERSRGWVVKQALSAWVEQEKERRRLTLEAMADMDEGHVIDHQAVEAWASSLDSDKPLQPSHGGGQPRQPAARGDAAVAAQVGGAGSALL